MKIKGTNQSGDVVHVEKDINKIKWDGNRPLFILVATDRGIFEYYAPYSLKKEDK